MPEIALELYTDDELSELRHKIALLFSERRLAKNKDTLSEFIGKYYKHYYDLDNCEFVYFLPQKLEIDGCLECRLFAVDKYGQNVFETSYFTIDGLDNFIEISKEEYLNELDKFIQFCNKFLKGDNE